MNWLLGLVICVASRPSQAQGESAGLARSARMACSDGPHLFWLPADPTGAAATALAARDIPAGTPFLELPSGEAPVVCTTDAAVEQQFHVEYFARGCTSPSPVAERAYNARIATYLHAKHGRAWRRHVRPDVVGRRPGRPRS